MTDIKFLFFPAVGNAKDGKVNKVGDYGNYWSVSLNDGKVNNAWNFNFDGDLYEVNNDNRYYGNSVRPVRLQHLFSSFYFYRHGFLINEKTITF